MLESLFNKVLGNFSSEYCEIFKNSYSEENQQAAASAPENFKQREIREELSLY